MLNGPWVSSVYFFIHQSVSVRHYVVCSWSSLLASFYGPVLFVWFEFVFSFLFHNPWYCFSDLLKMNRKWSECHLPSNVTGKELQMGKYNLFAYSAFLLLIKVFVAICSSFVGYLVPSRYIFQCSILSMVLWIVKAVRVQLKAGSVSVMLTSSELCQSQPAGKQLTRGTTGDECLSSETPVKTSELGCW